MRLSVSPQLLLVYSHGLLAHDRFVFWFTAPIIAHSRWCFQCKSSHKLTVHYVPKWQKDMLAISR